MSDPFDRPPEAPVPSTQRGPLAGLEDLARLLGQPGSNRRRLAGGIAVGALLAALMAGFRIRRRRR
jgi:hypothetical protein